ncbi:hypothetical protein JKP88DRAFT_261687 [Tribonema minus]|uniref:Uncharacterized protein n=1 Tax=Tribonema minus TaxID=303371 RepID=A0A836C8U2_9STRA|nr:hypothetical protein JKP88DRAFT_261687 [Tribonema minus]
MVRVSRFEGTSPAHVRKSTSLLSHHTVRRNKLHCSAGMQAKKTHVLCACRAYATEAAWLTETALHRVARDSPFSWAAAAARMRGGGYSSGGGGGGVRRRGGSSAIGDDGGSGGGGAPVYGWVVNAVKARKRPRPVPAMTRLMRSLFQLGPRSHDSGGGGGGGGGDGSGGSGGGGGGGSLSDTGSGASDGKRRGRKRHAADCADDAQHDSADNGMLTRGLSASDNGGGSMHIGTANGRSRNGGAAAGEVEVEDASVAPTVSGHAKKPKKKRRAT